MNCSSRSLISCGKAVLALFLFALLFFQAPCALAQTSFDITADGRNTKLSSVQGNDQIRVAINQGRCYCCDIQSVDPDDQARFNPVISEIPDSGTQFTVTETGGLEPRLQQGEGRFCFRGQGTGNVLLSMRFGPGLGTGTASEVSVSCADTTLFSNFNTSVADFNFAEIQSSQGSRRVSVYINATDVVSGSAVITDDHRGVDAGSRIDVDIHTPAGRGAFGPIVVCPLAPPGTIVGSVVQYKITSTTPLAFEPVTRESFVSRR